MKLIQEASVDESFNKLMLKIQDSIEALEKLVPKMDHPVSSQPRMVEVASSDLKKIAELLTSQRASKGMK